MSPPLTEIRKRELIDAALKVRNALFKKGRFDQSEKELLEMTDKFLAEEKVRLARCNDCGKLAISDKNLAWFKEKPEKEHDDFYCGCYGWD